MFEPPRVRQFLSSDRQGAPSAALFISDTMLQQIRDKFWYVTEDSSGQPRVFLDSAAGSLVLKQAQAAIDRSSRMSSYNGAVFHDSSLVDELIEQARTSVARLLNARSPQQIFTGESTTAVLRRLAQAILAGLPDRSRVLISAADHNANIDPWRHTASELGQKQFDVQMVRFEPATGTIDLNHLESLVNPRVRLMAVSHASNVLGAENPIREIRQLLERTSPQALLIVDGVHFAPHGPIDVQAMRADAYVFSSYKIFAQRGMSFAYVSERISRRPHYKLKPAPDAPPESWELGFRNPADFAPIIEVVDYLAWLGNERFPAPSPDAASEKRQRVKRGQSAIRMYENELVQAMFDGVGSTAGLTAIDGVTIYGPRQPAHYHLKEPTFSFNIAGRSSREVEMILWDQHRIALRSGDHYAPETLKQLGVTDCVRASLAHYNTIDEVREFLEAVGQLVSGSRDR